MDKDQNRLCGVCLKPRYQCSGSNSGNGDAGTSVPASSAPEYVPATDWREDITDLMTEIGVALDEITKVLRKEIERTYVHPGLIPNTHPLVRTAAYTATANAAIELGLQTWDRARREGAV